MLELCRRKWAMIGVEDNFKQGKAANTLRQRRVCALEIQQHSPVAWCTWLCPLIKQLKTPPLPAYYTVQDVITVITCTTELLSHVPDNWKMVLEFGPWVWIKQSASVWESQSEFSWNELSDWAVWTITRWQVLGFADNAQWWLQERRCYHQWQHADTKQQRLETGRGLMEVAWRGVARHCCDESVN